jgi:hypothetical protein
VACESALPAADFDLAAARPSRSTADAFRAAAGEVCLFGAFRCESALAAALFDFAAVDPLRSVLDAWEAAFLPVTLAIRQLLAEDAH